MGVASSEPAAQEPVTPVGRGGGRGLPQPTRWGQQTLPSSLAQPTARPTAQDAGRGSRLQSGPHPAPQAGGRKGLVTSAPGLWPPGPCSPPGPRVGAPGHLGDRQGHSRAYLEVQPPKSGSRRTQGPCCPPSDCPAPGAEQSRRSPCAQHARQLGLQAQGQPGWQVPWPRQGHHSLRAKADSREPSGEAAGLVAWVPRAEGGVWPRTGGGAFWVMEMWSVLLMVVTEQVRLSAVSGGEFYQESAVPSPAGWGRSGGGFLDGDVTCLPLSGAHLGKTATANRGRGAEASGASVLSERHLGRFLGAWQCLSRRWEPVAGPQARAPQAPKERKVRLRSGRQRRQADLPSQVKRSVEGLGPSRTERKPRSHLHRMSKGPRKHGKESQRKDGNQQPPEPSTASSGGAAKPGQPPQVRAAAPRAPPAPPSQPPSRRKPMSPGPRQWAVSGQASQNQLHERSETAAWQERPVSA